MADLGKVEVGTIILTSLTLLGGGCARIWRWLTSRKREEVDLDDSQVRTLGRSWELQERLTKYWTEQFSALRAEIATLQAEHAACERTTMELRRQNDDQAKQLAEMRREIEVLRQQINPVNRLRAV
jgi:hypothetical protein